MMTLTQIVTRVCNRLNKDTNNTTVIARIKNHINDACQEKWINYAWSFRWREYPLVLSPQVTSGTLTATNGSQTVTASGTPFIVGTHEGAWLRFMTDTFQSWYRVTKVVSTSSIIVEPAYQGTTGPLKTYQLCKTDYDLPLELSDLGRLKITYNGSPLQVQHQVQLDGFFQPPLSVGAPYACALYTQDFTSSTYTTGTVSGTINTTTLTGVGTAWLANIQPGDEIVINGDTNTYKVQSVQSDTSLTLYNKLLAAPSTSTYVMTRQYQFILRVQPCPDQSYVCFARGLRGYAPLINNADTNELILRFPFAVIESAVWREASSSPDSREDSLYQKSERMWAEAQADDTEILPQTNYAPIWNARNDYR